ncbi:MAG: PAS domain-containing protein [Comamonadaceae bacterium]|nr:PAS domain-containing protein [Comamonadaceae bacterium]
MPTSSRFDPERIALLDAFLSTLFDIPETDRSAYARTRFAFLDAVTPFDVLGLNRFRNAGAAEVEAIREEAGKLVHVLRRGLVRFPWNREVHPALVALRKENGDVTAAVLALAPLFSKLKDAKTRIALAARIRAFATLERKFRKAELLLHPALDPHLPSPIPLKVLWALHDDIRAVVRELPVALEAGSGRRRTAGRTRRPVPLRRHRPRRKGRTDPLPRRRGPLDPGSLGIASTPRCPGSGSRSAPIRYPVSAPVNPIHPASGTFECRTGRLDFDQLSLILGALPVELTFIDEHDVTRYYNDTKEKMFARTPQILGRPIMNCHPGKVVKSVEGMLSAFKAGKADRAEMWIDLHGRFVHIVYAALRDAEVHLPRHARDPAGCDACALAFGLQ